MAAPSALIVTVDQDEYSRLEVERDTINVVTTPRVPTQSIAAATLSGVTALTMQSVTGFPTSGFPYAAALGSGPALETVSVTAIDPSTLIVTLAAPTTKAHAFCEPLQLVVDLAGEQVVLQLTKARRNRDVVVATITVNLNGLNSVATAFYLPGIVDENDAARVHRGKYFISAMSVTDPTVAATTPDFKVSLLSVSRFKHDWLHGADEQALETESIKNQPVIISGVTVSAVSRGHQKGWITLSYNYTNPGNCQPIVRTLSWCDGPMIPIRPGTAKYTLRKGDSQLDWIDVMIPSIDALPTSSVAEQLLVDREALTDDMFANWINSAINWVEKTALSIYLEPTRIVTEIDPNQITYPAGSDIPQFVLADWDENVDALTYTCPAAGHWINFKMPYYPIIAFNSLYGKVSNVRIVDIAIEWVEFHKRAGFVELVPFNQETAFNFIGLMWVESIRGPIPIPNFWNFDALVGFTHTPAILMELVAKKAAIDALTKIGQAYRPGVSSQSVSRDGVSESVSYLTAGMYGIFSGAIKSYREWIDINLPMLRGSYRGALMAVV